MGLSASIPMIMKEKGASYQALSVFSLVSIPFSLKLFWAPLVDSIYISSMGRRKTWLIPVQLLCGALMLVVSRNIDGWMDTVAEDGSRSPDVHTLTAFFMILYFLMATQDIAVDGWALTMLSRANVGYASTCNAIGQVLGFFFANQGFIVLSDKKWCHNVLGLSSPLFDLSSFMAFWGVVFIVLTLLVWVFKVEVPLNSDDEPDGIVDTYRQMYSISKLKNVRIFILVLMTSRVALAPNDSVAMFKMQEYGAFRVFFCVYLLHYLLWNALHII
jgi:PAT family acetyl-CoA transporter-like MFS transporter 1